MENTLVRQDYWDASYESLALDINISNDPVAHFIRSTLKKHGTKNGSVLEVGCYPGRYLRVFGEFNYQLNGIDLTPKVETELPQFLAKKGCLVGTFRQIDFFNSEFSGQYDVVCSFGFLEHFTNWEEVILRHFEMVRKGGILILTVPNFYGTFQFLLHRTFDNINLNRHNIKAMDINSWKKLFNANSFEIDYLYAGYFGHFDFWTDHQTLHKAKQTLLNAILWLKDELKKANLPNSKYYSPYAGIVIRKK